MNIIDEKKFIKMKDKMIYLDSGDYGIIYKLDEVVIKIFRDPLDKTKKTVDRFLILNKVKTNRFIMPNDIISANNKITGLTMTYINNKNYNLNNINMNLLLSELNLIKEDISTFTEERIAIRDCHRGNFIFNDKLYIIDTDDYKPILIYPDFLKIFDTRKRSYNLNNINLYQMNKGIINFFCKGLGKSFNGASKAKFNISLNNGLNKLNGQYESFIGDFLKKDINGSETLETYAKRKIKQITKTTYYLY